MPRLPTTLSKPGQLFGTSVEDPAINEAEEIIRRSSATEPLGGKASLPALASTASSPAQRPGDCARTMSANGSKGGHLYMSVLVWTLEQARRTHRLRRLVYEGYARVAAQQTRLRRLRATGNSTADAERLLDALATAQLAMYEHLRRSGR